MSERQGSLGGSLLAQAKELAKPLAKKLVYGSALEPSPATRPLLGALFTLDFALREGYELARRALWATPIFLSRCAVHGTDVRVDRLPYIVGPTRIEVGSNIRISGKIGIKSPGRNPLGKEAVLKLGNGVFIANDCTFVVADRVELGDFVSVGSGCYIADTDGHHNYNPNRPIWEVPATADEVGAVTIEDNVQISRGCLILRGVRIGARSIIGAGSIVRSDIPPDSVVAGNPARVIKKMVPTSAG